MENWNIAKSLDLYGLPNWGEGYFDINSKGNMVVRSKESPTEIDLYELVSSLVQRGIEAPVLIRFDGIIRDRVRRIQSAFDSAIREFGYSGSYCPVYPIKVNQQRQVVDVVREAGRENKLGLEVGSKPELIAVLAIHDTPGALLLCNGYKDREYIELALLANKLGRRAIIIVEQTHELDYVLEIAAAMGVEAEIGIRMKPAAKATGRWESSGGDKAKFGLNTMEIMQTIQTLKNKGKIDWVKLLHFHIGSQITSISSIKKVLREATRMYTELYKECPKLCFFDAGGGLAVDYDGSKTNFESSMNYTVEEYARDIVFEVGQACGEANVPVPNIITESGRAVVAHHSALLFQVIDTVPCLDVMNELERPPSDHETLHQLWSMYQELNVKNCHETLNDALSLRDDILERFNTGDLSLAERAYADKSYWHLMSKIKLVAKGLKYLPEDLEKLDNDLKDTFICNFSVFQSLPDFWAISNLFPVVPIHRLTEEPTRRAVIADVSCDSDGKIDKFVDLKDVGHYVKLHSHTPDKPYYIGVFLVGAYQEILGDLHNLFGDTNAVHISVSPDGHPELSHVVEGDTIREVLKYVQYDPQDLTDKLRAAVEKSLKAGLLTNEDAAKLQKRYKEAMEGYTYLDKP